MGLRIFPDQIEFREVPLTALVQDRHPGHGRGHGHGGRGGRGRRHAPAAAGGAAQARERGEFRAAQHPDGGRGPARHRGDGQGQVLRILEQAKGGQIKNILLQTRDKCHVMSSF